MQIEIPNEQYDALTERAQAAGYAGVPELIRALAVEPIEDPRGEMSEGELAESLRMLSDSEADIAAGRVSPLRDALQEIAAKHGLTVDR